MNGGLVKTMTMATAGFLYGVLLAVVGLMAAGAGHGTYVLLGLYASPLSLVQMIALALFGTPLLWCLVGVLLAGVGKSGRTIAFFLTMLAHYASLPFVLKEGNTFGDWAYAAKEWGFVRLGIGIYVVGQAAIWIVFLAGLFSSLIPARRTRILK